jgi:NADP-dependent 3-hydroxy acid dehydrogenase YdfG
VLINNAGVAVGGTFEQVSDELIGVTVVHPGGVATSIAQLVNHR